MGVSEEGGGPATVFPSRSTMEISSISMDWYRIPLGVMAALLSEIRVLKFPAERRIKPS
jgi:hypothetical protein